MNDRTRRRVLFLTSPVTLPSHNADPTPQNDNHQRLPRAFLDAGWTVFACDADRLQLGNNTLSCDSQSLTDFDLIWPLGFGRQASFLDRMQLLSDLDPMRFVVTPDALTYLHGKFHWLEHMPTTYAGRDAEQLVSPVHDGERWVVKPSAGSYGRAVHFVTTRDAAKRAAENILAGGGYCIVQRYVHEISNGELRVLCAGGRLIACYERSSPDGTTTNVFSGAIPNQRSMTPDERHLAQGIATDLATRGVGFAAIDLAYPYLIEVNIANPGGLATLEMLTQRNFASNVVQAIAQWRGF